MKLYLLYSGNAWLNTSSLRLLAICSTVENARELALSHSIHVKSPLSDSESEELERNNQTYGRDENYLICESHINELDI